MRSLYFDSNGTFLAIGSCCRLLLVSIDPSTNKLVSWVQADGKINIIHPSNEELSLPAQTLPSVDVNFYGASFENNDSTGDEGSIYL